MAYLNLDPDYFDHPKTLLLVALLGSGSDVLPLRLWAYCSKFSPKDGVIGKRRPIEVESLIRWWGEDGLAIRGLMRSGFVGKTRDGYVVHDWKHHQGHIWALQQRNKKVARNRWDKIRKSRSTVDTSGTPKSTTSVPLSSPYLTSPNQTERVSSAPSLSDAKGYATERGGVVDAQKFHDHYSSVGWMVNGQPVKDWKALMRKWEANEDPVKIAAVKAQEMRCRRPGCGLAGNWAKGQSSTGVAFCAACLEEEAVELERAGT